jgi:hypothetical protein
VRGLLITPLTVGLQNKLRISIYMLTVGLFVIKTILCFSASQRGGPS